MKNEEYLFVEIMTEYPSPNTRHSMRNKALILLLLIIYTNGVSGMDVPQPEKLVVDISDGEVIVFWKHPLDAPSNYQYNVQMAKYTSEWATVGSCTGITKTYCDLTGLIHDYGAGYKVKVQLVTRDGKSAWTMKKFLPNRSELQPPSFTLWATSSTLTVYVPQKPILKKLFPYGPIYTIYLQEKGQDDKNISAYLKDDVEEDQRTKTFSSLHWGRDYCVSVKVEGNGALSASSVSPKQCLQLPEQEWFIIAVTSLSSLGVLAFVAITATFLLCYLKRPEKTPVVLKSPMSGWFPLIVGDGTPEVVTDKGWILSSSSTKVINCAKDTVPHVTVTEDDGEENRRTILDSGVGMEFNSTKNSRESPPMRQVDSGHGSFGGPESSAISQTDFPLQEESTVIDIAKKTLDSGEDLCCRLNSSSMNVNGHDRGSLKEAVAGGTYRSQIPSAIHIQDCDDDEGFKQRLHESVVAKVVTGYRAGPQWCMCSGAGQCSWCRQQGLYGSGVIKQCRPMCIENGLQGNKCDFDSYKGIPFSTYSKQTQMETPFIQLGETLLQRTALPQRPLLEGEKDFNMNNVSLSLCDVQLTND